MVPAHYHDPNLSQQSRLKKENKTDILQYHFMPFLFSAISSLELCVFIPVLIHKFISIAAFDKDDKEKIFSEKMIF